MTNWQILHLETPSFRLGMTVLQIADKWSKWSGYRPIVVLSFELSFDAMRAAGILIPRASRNFESLDTRGN